MKLIILDLNSQIYKNYTSYSNSKYHFIFKYCLLGYYFDNTEMSTIFSLT